MWGPPVTCYPALAVVAVGAIILVFAVPGGIYNAALYRYAATGEAPALFPQDVVRQEWRRR